MVTGAGMPRPGVNSPPLIITSAYSADVVERVKRRVGRFFAPIHADISACIATLTQVDRYVYIHDPLSLRGKADENCAYELYRPERGRAHVGELGEAGRLTRVRLPFVTLWNLTFETVLRMKEVMAEELRGLELPLPRYFARCHEDLLVLRRNGVDVAAEIEGLRRAVEALPAGARVEVRRALGLGLRQRAAGAARRVIDRSLFLERLERAARRVPVEWGWVNRKLVIRGEAAGFGSILECARWLGDGVRDELHGVWRGTRRSVPGHGVIVPGNPWKVV